MYCSSLMWSVIISDMNQSQSPAKNVWTASHTQTTTASPKALWQHYTTVANWPKEDTSLETAQLEGDFVVGSKIVMKPKGAPKSTVTITKVVPMSFYSTQGSIPLGKLLFTHEITKSGKTTSFTHTITVTGPLRKLFVKMVVQKLADNLPTKMTNIAKLAESAEK